MAQKSRKPEEYLSLKAETQKTVSYADYFSQRPVFTALKIKNDGAQDENGLKIILRNENGLLLPFEKTVDVPFESTVELEVGNILSPLYFVSLEEEKTEEVIVELRTEKKIIFSQTLTVNTLPLPQRKQASISTE